ncbi:MAG TPA: hypothetical protein VER96_05640 [Polyangiaceae bacterium]|nr:hypothetical protein [Polyangiaceae bacterium]
MAELVRWARGGAVFLFALSSARSALGFPSSRLVYMRGPGAENCPDQASVRDAVKKRLGYDPFFPSSDKIIIARVMRDGSKLRGEVELVDEQSSQVGKREFAAEQDQCEQLVHAMALSISIAIDPKSAETYAQGPENPAPEPRENEPASSPSAEAPVVTAATPPAAPPIASPARSSPQIKRWLWSAGLGATVQFGSMPKTAFGATAFGAVRSGAWSLALEGELDAPMTAHSEGVELRSSGGALKLLPCGHWKLMSACQITALRWLAATGTPSGLGGSAGSLALGGRLGVELPLSPKFGALAYGDLLLTPLPVHLESQGNPLWKTPIFSGGLGIAAVVHF